MLLSNIIEALSNILALSFTCTIGTRYLGPEINASNKVTEFSNWRINSVLTPVTKHQTSHMALMVAIR